FGSRRNSVVIPPQLRNRTLHSVRFAMRYRACRGVVESCADEAAVAAMFSAEEHPKGQTRSSPPLISESQWRLRPAEFREAGKVGRARNDVGAVFGKWS